MAGISFCRLCSFFRFGAVLFHIHLPFGLADGEGGGEVADDIGTAAEHVEDRVDTARISPKALVGTPIIVRMEVIEMRLEFWTAESPMDRMKTAMAMVAIMLASSSTL